MQKKTITARKSEEEPECNVVDMCFGSRIDTSGELVLPQGVFEEINVGFSVVTRGGELVLLHGAAFSAISVLKTSTYNWLK